MKYLKVGIIAILLVIIAALSTYIALTNNAALLKIPINFYLKKYKINAEFKKIRVNSQKSIELKDFLVRKNGIKFFASYLRLSIDKKGKIILILKNPTVTIVQKSETKSGSFKLPFNISKISIVNLNLTILKNNNKILEAKGVNIKIDNNTVKAKGNILYKNTKSYIKADIKSLNGTLKLSRSFILLDNLYINPSIITAKIDGISIDTSKPLKINGLYITFSPFGIKLNGLISSIGLHIQKRFFYADIKTDILYSRHFDISSYISNIKTKNDTLSGDYIKLSATNKKKLQISISYKNISLNTKNLIAQNLCGKITYNAKKTEGQCDKGEAVGLNRWYINFANNPIYFGFIEKPKYKLNLYIKNLFKANLALKGKNEIIFSLSSDNVRELFDTFVKNAYESGFINEIHVGKGLFDIKGRYDIKTKSLCAYVNLKDKKVKYKKRFELTNIVVNLPIFYNCTKQGTGFLRIDNISLGDFHLSLRSFVVATRDNVVFKSNLSSTNRLNIKPFTIIYKPKQKTLTSSLFCTLKNKNGLIVCKLKHIELKHNRISTEGHINIKMFDGTIDISKLSASGISGIPTIYANINFKHINLEKITKDTNFGLVSGYVEGYIHNLSLVNFTNPLSFTMLIKTQNVKGASKRITLKAINSISKIGGGYVKIAMPFFKSFPYSKIGLYATLKNNNFTMHGLYKDKNTEYIIKKGFLFGVSVINMNKNNSICWDDMIDRIKRILKNKNVEIK